MEEEKQGVSFGDILHVLRKRIIWVIAVTLVIGIIGTLIIQFVYNKNEKTYTLGFDIEFPGIEDNVYPDGTTFKINEVISSETLNNVKNSGDYSNIDVDTIISENDISITLVKISADDDSKDEKLTSYHYNLVVPAKYFKNKDQATSFLKTAVETPITKVNELVDKTNYVSNLRAFENCTTSYADKISYLEAQKNYIVSVYNELINLCNEDYAVYSDKLSTIDNGATLKDFKDDIENILSTTDVSYLRGVVKEKYYVLKTSFDYAAYADSQIVILQKEKTENEAKISSLNTALANIIALYNDPSVKQDTIETQSSTFENQIASLVSRNADIDVKISDLTKEKTQWNKASDAEQTAFDNKLVDYSNSLKNATDTLKVVRSVVYAEKTEVEYTTYNVTAAGGLNIFLGILISLVIGFVLIAIIVCCVDLPKYLREKNAPVTVPEVKPEEPKSEENK